MVGKFFFYREGNLKIDQRENVFHVNEKKPLIKQEVFKKKLPEGQSIRNPS